jgi:FkbM family methyltransferase
MAIEPDLVYDLGLHEGEDTDYYLAKGYRVVAVDASPDLCEAQSKRLAGPIADGRLTIINAAIAAESGPVTFYASPVTIWGTTNREFADRNERCGAGTSTEITVEGVEFGSLLAKYGIPHFAKIDIEGADVLCLEGLRGRAEVPHYLSIESEKRTWDGLLGEFDLLSELGYERFKVVPQHQVHRQRPAGFTFQEGASGMFGEDAPGAWLTRDEAVRVYRRIFVRYRLAGDFSPLKRNQATKPVASALYFLMGGPWWYDTHARHSSVN